MQGAQDVPVQCTTRQAQQDRVPVDAARMRCVAQRSRSTMTIATEEELGTLKRAEVRVYLTENLSCLPSHQGLAIAAGVYIEVAKRHGLTREKAIECLRRSWDIDHESGPVHFKDVE